MKQENKLCEGYLGTSIVFYFRKEYNLDLIKLSFINMALSLNKKFCKIAKKAPREDYVTIMTCKTYTLEDYREAFPKIFKGKEEHYFKCRVCGFVRSEYVSSEDVQKGIKCWLNNCGGIMDKLEVKTNDSKTNRT